MQGNPLVRVFVDLTLVGGVPRLLLCRETPLVRVFVDLTLVGGVPRLLLCRETPLVRVFVDLTLVGGVPRLLLCRETPPLTLPTSVILFCFRMASETNKHYWFKLFCT